MFYKFSGQARKVMALANMEAQRLNHEFIGTEHMLLGVINEGSGSGANALKSLGIDLEKLQAEVKKILEPGPDVVEAGRLPQTPHSKQVIEWAIEEANSFKHKYVGTGHMLLGLLRANDSATAKLLINKGLKLEDVRKEVLRLHKTDKE